MKGNFGKLVAAALFISAVVVTAGSEESGGECTVDCNSEANVEVESAESLESWMLRDCPGTVIKAELVQSGSGEYRTLRSRVSLHEDDIVIGVPKQCMLSNTLAIAESETIRKVLQPNEDGESPASFDRPGHVAITMYLLENWNDSSNKFQPYFASLPETDWSHLPGKWTEDDLKELKGTDVMNFATEIAARVAEDYKAICSIDASFCEKYNFEKFEEMRYMVSTRCYNLANEGELAMAPFADQINHEAQHNVRWAYDPETEMFEMRAIQKIPIGEQIFTAYGAKANSALLAHYGFALTSNLQPNGASFDHVSVELRDPSGKAEPQKFRIMLMMDQFFETGEALDYLRRAVVETDAEKAHVKAFGEPLKENSAHMDQSSWIFLGARNEVAALKLLSQHMSERLKEYPHTLEETEALLKSDNLSSNQRNALLVSKGEQSICYFWIETAKQMTEVLTENKGPRLAAMLRFFPKADKNRAAYAKWLHGRVVAAEAKQEKGMTDIV